MIEAGWIRELLESLSLGLTYPRTRPVLWISTFRPLRPLRPLLYKQNRHTSSCTPSEIAGIWPRNSVWGDRHRTRHGRVLAAQGGRITPDPMSDTPVTVKYIRCIAGALHRYCTRYLPWFRPYGLKAHVGTDGYAQIQAPSTP